MADLFAIGAPAFILIVGLLMSPPPPPPKRNETLGDEEE